MFALAMSTPSDDIIKVDDDRRLVFGWAYIAKDAEGNVIVDRQGDFVDDDWELENAAYDFVLKSGIGDEMHLDVPVSDVVESVVFTAEKIEKMGLPPGSFPTGWWVGFKVHDDRVWADVKAGRLRSFSIGGKGIREKVDA